MWNEARTCFNFPATIPSIPFKLTNHCDKRLFFCRHLLFTLAPNARYGIVSLRSLHCLGFTLLFFFPLTSNERFFIVILKCYAYFIAFQNCWIFWNIYTANDKCERLCLTLSFGNCRSHHLRQKWLRCQWLIYSKWEILFSISRIFHRTEDSQRKNFSTSVFVCLCAFFVFYSPVRSSFCFMHWRFGGSFINFLVAMYNFRPKVIHCMEIMLDDNFKRI